MTLDGAESSSRGREADTNPSHHDHGPSNDGLAAQAKQSFHHPAPTTAATATAEVNHDGNHRHKSRRASGGHHASRLANGHYHSNVPPLTYLPQEILYDSPFYHNLRRHRDARGDTEPHSYGRSHRSRRRHHRPRHVRRHRALAADDQGYPSTRMTMPGSGMESAQQTTSDGKDGEDIVGDPATSTQVDAGSEIDDLSVGQQFPFVCRRENITFEHVMMEQDRRKKLEDTNHESLSNLAGRSIDLSRRLDAAYYSLLETAANLRSAITSFQDLKGLTTDVQTTFKRESLNLEQDHKRQVAEFNNFEAQVRRVVSLEGCMQRCREKGLALDKRLAAVKAKINAWDRREEQWQARVSRRLRILWGFMGLVALAFAVVRFFEQIRPVPGALDDSEPGHGSSTPSNLVRPSQNLSFLTPDTPFCVAEDVQDKEERLVPHSPSPSPSPWQGLTLDGLKESSCRVDAEPVSTETTPTTRRISDDPLQRVIDEL